MHKHGHNQTVQDAHRALAVIGARARMASVFRCIAYILAGLFGALLVAGTIDFFLRLPGPVRILHWVIGAALLGAVTWRWLLPAFRRRPSIINLALRVERNTPELQGVLASGIELGEITNKDDEHAITAALARHVAAEAGNAWGRAKVGQLIRWQPLLRAGASLVLVLAVIATLASIQPRLVAIGAVRATAPWVNSPWPKRTAVADMTGARVHPTGQALPLRAAILRSNRAIENTDVYVRYRLLNEDGSVQSVERLLMTHQARTIEVDGALAARSGLLRESREGHLFERLVETDAESIEYRFETEDDQTDWRMVTIVDPPAVLRASSRIEPPEYASAAITDDAGLIVSQPTTLVMGAGADERAVTPPLLEESIVSFTIELNKPAVFEPENEEWILATFGEDMIASEAQFESSDDALSWTVHWRLTDSMRIPISLVDGHGIESVDESIFRFQSVTDGPPSVSLLEPTSDVTVLPTAVVDLRAEARDDVGLREIWMTRQRFAPAGETEPSGPGGAVAPTEEPVRIIGVDATGEASAEIETTLDLSVLGVVAGDQVWIMALATDIYAGRSPDSVRSPAESVVRRLLILSETEFIEQIRGELAGVRQAAISIDAQQRALRERADTASDEQRRGQDQITSRIGREQEQIEALTERIEQNGLDDPGLDTMLETAQRLLREAGARSTEASETLDDATKRDATEQTESAALTGEEREQLEQSRQGVEEQLVSLVELLDRGEDAWVLRRKIEDLLQEQQELREETTQAGAETAGRTPEELSEDQRSELERIVERQQELAERMRDTVDELQEGQERLEESDPSAAAGLAQAARRAREENVEEKMEDAAEAAEENRMSSATSMQQQAEQAMEQMLEDIERADQAREEVLRRLLLSLISSLDSLIVQQETELERLDAADEAGDLSDLDRAMVALNRNTLGVHEQAREGGAELGAVASLIMRASEAQVRAIIALRKAPPDGADARLGELESLQRLREAREEAEQMQNQVEERIRDKKIDALRAAYRDALQRELDLRREVAPFVDMDELTRRQRAQVRGLSEGQEEIRQSLVEIREEMQEIADAAVFDYTHQRVDAAMSRAGELLGDASPDTAATQQDRAIALLQALLEAMEEASRNDDDFRQASGGGGGGSQGGEQEQPLIPDLTQLRLMRQIQADLADRTRAADEAAEPLLEGDVEELGKDQRDLAELGEALIEKLQQEMGGAPVEQGEPTEQ